MTDPKTKQAVEQWQEEMPRSQAATPLPPEGGSYILADNGQFLGNIDSNRGDPNSLLHSQGPYGSRYSATSIFNRFSLYGSKYRLHSPFNPYTQTPPKIFLHGTFWRYLTKNRRKAPAIDPEVFLELLVTDLESLLQGFVPDLSTASRR